MYWCKMVSNQNTFANYLNTFTDHEDDAETTAMQKCLGFAQNQCEYVDLGNYIILHRRVSMSCI